MGHLVGITGLFIFIFSICFGGLVGMLGMFGMWF